MLYHKRLTQHKYLEIELQKFKIQDTCSWFHLNIDWSTKRDHAGFEISLDILGYSAIIKIYDHRHWDGEKQEWCSYEKND